MAIRMVLASGSPRRRALLEALGIDLEVCVSDADEHETGEPVQVAVDNASTKRDMVMALHAEPAVVVAADTIVVVDGDILGKPRDLDEARDMISRLSGRGHDVITGLAVGHTGTNIRLTAHETTRVVFRDLSPPEIAAFVDAVRPLDRAGAYTVDGPGSLLVERYDGCFYNVLGLPIVRLDALLRKMGLSLFDAMDARKAVFL